MRSLPQKLKSEDRIIRRFTPFEIICGGVKAVVVIAVVVIAMVVIVVAAIMVVVVVVMVVIVIVVVVIARELIKNPKA